MYRGQRLRATLDRANAGVREGGFPRYGAEDVEGLVDRERDMKWAKQEKKPTRGRFLRLRDAEGRFELSQTVLS
jgi:hypothetical protein